MTALELRLIGIVAAIAAAGFGIHLLLAAERAQGAAECQAAQAKATTAFNAQSAEQSALWAKQTQKAVSDGQAKLIHMAQAVSGVGTALDAAVERVRHDTPGSCSEMPSDTAASAGGAAASAPSGMPADLFRRLGEATKAISQYADTLAVSNAVCVAGYPTQSK